MSQHGERANSLTPVGFEPTTSEIEIAIGLPTELQGQTRAGRG